MCWRIILEEFGNELKYIKGENNVVADALSSIEMSGNQEILNISELYGYDEEDLPNSAYPIFYHGIAKAQKTDSKLQQKLVSHKDYTLDTFCGGDKNHRLICRNNKICLPAALQTKAVVWYHEMLCHPGETQTEHTLCQHFDWKVLCTTVHDMDMESAILCYELNLKTLKAHGFVVNPYDRCITNSCTMLFCGAFT